MLGRPSLTQIEALKFFTKKLGCNISKRIKALTVARQLGERKHSLLLGSIHQLVGVPFPFPGVALEDFSDHFKMFLCTWLC